MHIALLAFYKLQTFVQDAKKEEWKTRYFC